VRAYLKELREDLEYEFGITDEAAPDSS